MSDIIKKMSAIGVIPVIKIDDIKTAVPLAKALLDGGLPVAEVTFRTAAGPEAIAQICKAYPEMLVGAGTILTIEQVDVAVAAGAKFIVTPGFNLKVVEYCVKNNIVVTPGCINPSDIELALELGLEVVKFFPAEAAGGIKMIKALAAPYHTVQFMPTGGINEKNINDYLSFNKIIACGGSWMVDPAMVNAGEYEKITALTKQAVHTIMGFELAHIGINNDSQEEAMKAAKLFQNLFGFGIKEGNSSVFAGDIELTKSKYPGKHGHIAIRCNYLSRAMAYLTSIGADFDMDSMKYDDKKKPVAVYLKEEIAGFAIHLVEKR